MDEKLEQLIKSRGFEKPPKECVLCARRILETIRDYLKSEQPTATEDLAALDYVLDLFEAMALYD